VQRFGTCRFGAILRERFFIREHGKSDDPAEGCPNAEAPRDNPAESSRDFMRAIEVFTRLKSHPCVVRFRGYLFSPRVIVSDYIGTPALDKLLAESRANRAPP
jgi:hypothetical protein